MNFLYGRTLFISIFNISILLFVYTNINYPQMEDNVPIYLSLVNVLVSLIFIILAFFRCRAIGWSCWRVFTIILPFVNIVLLFSLMYLATEIPSNKQNQPDRLKS